MNKLILSAIVLIIVAIIATVILLPEVARERLRWIVIGGITAVFLAALLFPPRVKPPFSKNGKHPY